MQTQTSATNTVLVDQNDRTRFCTEIDHNFSVIAPAGVGKTRAITDRIVNLILENQENRSKTDPAKLVVVTYTQKAANEMQQRVHQALLRKSLSSKALSTLNKVFFGTIHSFCLSLLKRYGHHLGLPNNFQLLSNDQALWLNFIRNCPKFSQLIESPLGENILKHVPIDKLLTLAQNVSPKTPKHSALPNYPDIDTDAIITHKPKKYAAKFDEKRNLVLRWIQNCKDNLAPTALPAFDEGPAEFKHLASDTFYPLWDWLGKASLNLAVDTAQAYQNYRLAKSFISYDDMIDLALKLINHPDAGIAIRHEGYCVILDEAQDTDKQQFDILLGIAQTIDSVNQLPATGRFSMVGDPQQSIYSSRADLPTYLKIHKQLVEENCADALTFSVTMRCDIDVVNHANKLFPNILSPDTTPKQVHFVPLAPRPWANAGNVLKLSIPYKKDVDPIEHESQYIANWLKDKSPEDLGIQNWCQLAILCPRKNWLTPITKAFAQHQIPFQIHSKDQTAAHNPTYAWLTAICTIVANPCDSFEIAGVLREIYGISDDDIAWHTRWFEKSPKQRTSEIHPLNILTTSQDNSSVGKTLNELHQIRQKALLLPLRDAIYHLAEATKLEQRLSLLPDYSSSELIDILNSLFMNGTLSEQENLSLHEFAEQLQNRLNNLVDEAPPQQNAIQCYTCHKSKGLEWDVVMVPFAFRSISFPPATYPQLGINHANIPPKIAVSAHPAKEAIDKERNLQRKAELQRLLYVTTTRARNTLIWIDDEQIFPSPQNSMAESLRVLQEGPNRAHWDDLPDKLLSQQPIYPKENQIIPEAIRPAVLDIDLAYKSARNFPSLKNPSKLVQTSALEHENQNESAVNYGIWWHAVMESMPWNSKDPTICNTFAQNQLTHCPIPERGSAELLAFCQTNLFKLLLSDHITAQTEVPFLWKQNQTAYEGIIDLIAFDENQTSYTVIDWKTDDITHTALESLKKKYTPQLSIYAKATEATALLYSTPLAETLKI